ncbi:hypothetical protein RJ639_014216 [Escallonia herrerae]|uniref:ADP/ATP translocase n=1 Tax=Escallonia herrerae TaxID=1293975 RepID=A0AA88VL95_9ASTE|nr:hypothetical protein RJ639_014216 [Escallonia herrerae]
MAAFKAPSTHTSHPAYGYYSNAGLRYPVNTSFVAANPSPVFIQAPSMKGAAGFAIDFLMGAVSAAVSKSAAAPIERAKLLIQNQDEMIKLEITRMPSFVVWDVEVSYIVRPRLYGATDTNSSIESASSGA